MREREDFPNVPLSQKAYEILRRQIITRELEPGTVLSEQLIASSLNMSRTPVREALARLQNEHLLKYVPQKGVSVREMTVRDFIDVATLFRALQEFSVTEMVRLGHEFSIDEIIRLHEEQKRAVDDPWRCLDLNIEMHTAIAGLLGNDCMTTVARNMADLVRLAGYVSSRANFNIAFEEVFREHDAITAALRARDLEAFSKALRRHDEGALSRMTRL
ncbi:MAG: GntR family transcriptional regulator [Clostridia bacterium]